MKKILALLLFLFIAVPAIPAVLTWNPSDTYEDSTLIPVDMQAQEIFITYYATTETGNWIEHSVTGMGVLTAQVPEPPQGVTYWYTIETELVGLRSAKAAPVSKTGPFPPAVPPSHPQGLAVH